MPFYKKLLCIHFSCFGFEISGTINRFIKNKQSDPSFHYTAFCCLSCAQRVRQSFAHFSFIKKNTVCFMAILAEFSDKEAAFAQEHVSSPSIL